MVESFKDDPELQGNIFLESGRNHAVGGVDVASNEHGFKNENSVDAQSTLASYNGEAASTLDEPVSETIVSPLNYTLKETRPAEDMAEVEDCAQSDQARCRDSRQAERDTKLGFVGPVLLLFDACFVSI